LSWAILALPFKSKWRLEAENAALRHQVMVLWRQARDRIHLTNLDRLFLVQLYRWFPSILQVLAIVQPETVIRWHRAGFRYLSLLKNVFGRGRGWPLIAADDFHRPRRKSGDSCDLSARHGNYGNQRI
jgi:hypothetical protein